MAEKSIETINEFAISAGQNLPNHSASVAGRSKFIRQGVPEVPTFRTKQQAYRYAAWLLFMADNHLPDEEGCEEHGFADIAVAIANT